MIKITYGNVTFKNPTRKDNKEYQKVLFGDSKFNIGSSNSEVPMQNLLNAKEFAFVTLCNKITINEKEYSFKDISEKLEPEGLFTVKDWNACEQYALELISGTDETVKKK